MNAALGVDIGGTAIKLGALAADGRVLARASAPYAGLASFDELVATVAAAARDLAPPEGFAAAGVAAPGYARGPDGVMADGTDNTPLLAGQPLGAAMSAALGLPVRVLNDGVAAALGEDAHGAGARFARFAMITLGTGVGGAVVVGGAPLTGPAREPPELGAMVLDAAPGAARRTFEDFACAAGFLAAYGEAGGEGVQTVEALFARAADDAAARAAIDAVAARIAQAAGTLINANVLDAVLLGGGIAQAGPPLLEAVRAHLPRFTWPLLAARASVELAQLGPDAGWIGAAAAARS